MRWKRVGSRPPIGGWRDRHDSGTAGGQADVRRLQSQNLPPKAVTVAVMAVLLAFFALLAFPGNASAHASLVSAVPAPNAALDQAPAKIELTFNERLEADLYQIRLYDQSGKIIVDRGAALSPDRTVLSLELPGLEDGRYTVSYHVISQDGHPVKGSYVWTVGRDRTDAAAGAGGTSGGADGSGDHAGHGGAHAEHGHQHGISAKMSPYEWLTYLSRIAYFFALLAAAGWALWGGIAGIGQAADSRLRHRRGLLALQRVHLLALILLIHFHYQPLLGDQGLEQLPGLFTGTWIGRSWLIALVLSLLGFILLGKSRVLDIAWAVLLLLAKTLAGHAMASDPLWAGGLLDFAHLLAASVWAGGLLIITLNWQKSREWTRRFVPLFSAWALWAVCVLVFSGIALTLLYLPGLAYLFYSQWGMLLLAKAAVVVFVLVIAVLIRLTLKRRNENGFRWLAKADFAAMSVIVVLVGVLTYLNPVPPNEPLYWHQMGEKVHLTLRISPNAPGHNRFTVDVWLAKELGEPRRVQLFAQHLDKPDLAPIEVPLEKSENSEEDAMFSPDDSLQKFSYIAEGPYIPFDGQWNMQFRLLDQNGDETVYEKAVRVYESR